MRNALILPLLALGACSSGGGNASVNNSAGATAPTGGASATAWNAADACALLPREAVAEAVGQPVTDAQLSRVTQGSAETAALSTCTYSFAGGRSLDFFARRSPVPDNDDASMKQTRDSTAQAMGGSAEDVPGLGKQTFWVSRANQLHVFAGEDRYFYFMSFSPPSGVDMKRAEIALARRVAG